MTKLYYSAGACSLAPHIALEWIGAPYEAKAVKFGSEELLAANPIGSVPVLEESDGWKLTQAGAILHYLAAKAPDADLLGDPSPRGQAEMMRWVQFLTSDLHGSFWAVFGPHNFTVDTSDSAKANVAEAAEKRVRKHLAVLERHLDGRDWILGEGKGQKSIIDAYAFPMSNWAEWKLSNGLDDFPNVKAFQTRMNQDEGVKRVLAVEAQG